MNAKANLETMKSRLAMYRGIVAALEGQRGFAGMETLGLWNTAMFECARINMLMPSLEAEAEWGNVY